MEQVIHRCKKCGIDLFEQLPNSKKIFRSFATKVRDGHEEYLCINCYKEGVENGVKQTGSNENEE